MENNQPQEPQIKEVEAVQDAGVARVSKKIIMWSLIGIAAVLVIAGIGYWMHQSGEEKAAEAMAQVDVEMNDSVQAAMYKKIADDGSYKANERAKLMVSVAAPEFREELDRAAAERFGYSFLRLK